MGRIQGLFERNNLTASVQIKGAPGELHSVSVSWTGATAGQIVCQLIDDTADNGVAGRIVLTVVADAANGNYEKVWPQGKACENGIFYKEGAVSNVYAELTAK